MQKPNVSHQPLDSVMTEAAPGISKMSDVLSIFKVIRADKIHDMSHLLRYQCMNPNCFYQGSDSPSIILYVSHKWEKEHNPDPFGTHLLYLKLLVDNIRKMIQGVSSTDENRLALIPTLAEHGVLQAGVIMYLAMMEMGNDGVSLKTDDDFISKIGIWYDYSCMPQRDSSCGVERTAEEKKSFDSQLLQLHNLFTYDKTLTICLRNQNDDYNTRGWCFVEFLLSHAAQIRRPLILRTDLINQPIGRTSLNEWFQAVTTSQIDSWEGSTNGNAFSILGNVTFEYSVMIGEKSDSTPHFVSKRLGSDISSVILATVIGKMTQQARHNPNGVYDLAKVVKHALISNRIKCTNDGDLAFVGFLVCEYLVEGDNLFSYAKKLYVQGGVVYISYIMKHGQPFKPLVDVMFHETLSI